MRRITFRTDPVYIQVYVEKKMIKFKRMILELEKRDLKMI